MKKTMDLNVAGTFCEGLFNKNLVSTFNIENMCDE